ncbi:MAG: DUF2520 domain-containing protein [Actinomycetota bacterium]|nr:DUF2520 domain-containing protein [Actinomycetota bacterium]
MSDPSSQPARFTVGVVGAGRVGAVIGAALHRAGHRVVGVSAVSEASLERARALLPGIPVLEVPDVVAAADLVLLAVPDDALRGLVGGLAATGAFRPGQVVIHTSGRHGVAVFEDAAGSDILPLAIHPAMTFTGTSVDLDRLTDCCFGVTTLKELRPLGEALVIEMGGEPVWVEEEDRPLYHAALAHGANHLVTLVAQAMELLEDAGVDRPGRVLAPLLSAALDNVLRSGDQALTGPVSRGDAGTLADHLSELAAVPEIRSTYVCLARATVQRAVEHGRLRPALADSVLAVLDEEGKGS